MVIYLQLSAELGTESKNFENAFAAVWVVFKESHTKMSIVYGICNGTRARDGQFAKKIYKNF